MTHGHLFVVQGDLTKIAADDVVVPTDVNLQPGPSWEAFGSTDGLKPPGWGNDGARVSKARRGKDGPRIRWLNTGTSKELDKQQWLADGIAQALAAVAEDVERDLDRSEHDQKIVNDRARHLLAVPLFGTGRGGFHEVRSDVIHMMLDLLTKFSNLESVDVVLVCRRRSDYGAVQSRRSGLLDAHCCLEERLLPEALRIGGLAREGSLALFMGAGVGVPAGLPTWHGLIEVLAKDTTDHEQLRLLSPPDAVAILSEDGKDKSFLRRLKKSLTTSRYSIGHAMLASMRIHEAVTTNFDALYESACDSSFFRTPLRVMPWERAEPDAPWLLKMHGDLERKNIVLSRDEFMRYDDEQRPLASIVQSLLMTRHVLFVGYSLTDDNFVRLARDVSRLLTKHRPASVIKPATGRRVAREREVGTVLTLFDLGLRARLWKEDLVPVPIKSHTDPGEKNLTAAASREHEVFLDCVALAAAADERSFVLDAKYKSLVDEEDPIPDKVSELAGLLRDAPETEWKALRSVLRNYGETFGEP